MIVVDNKINGEVVSIESATSEFAHPMYETELKLEYLRQLRGLNCETIFKDKMLERIVETCKSIESDLGIKKETVAGNMVVNLSVDTSKLEYGLKEVSQKTAEHAERIGNALRDAAKRISES
ncbi:MAG: hypothetical protein ACQEXX_19935 [Bacillota bacterium]